MHAWLLADNKVTNRVSQEMTWTSYTEQQVRQILKLAATGLKPVDICSRFGVPLIIFRSWQAKYGTPGAELGDEKVKQLEEENARLKRLVADLTLEIRAMQVSQEEPQQPKLRTRPGPLTHPRKIA